MNSQRFKCSNLKFSISLELSVNGYRGLSRRKIESVFGHFAKFNIRKADSSQNSLPEKQIFHKIQYADMKVSTIFWEFHSFLKKMPFKLLFRSMKLWECVCV